MTTSKDELAAAFILIEKLTRDLRQMDETLTATQKRCSEFNDQVRARNMAAQSLCIPEEWNATVEKALKDLRGPDKK